VTTICPNCDELVSMALEELASGPALVRRYNLRRASRAVHCEDVLEYARQGDPDAVRVVREAGEALGSGVGFLVNVLDPEVVVVGGGLGLAKGLYWDNFLDSLRRHIWADASRMLPVLRAELGTDAGLIGAAALATNPLLRSSGGLQSRP
jgi:glucokinase